MLTAWEGRPRPRALGCFGKGTLMSVVLVVSSPPYGSEGPYNALRLASALLLKEEWVEVFFIGEGVHAARPGQDPSGGGVSVESMLKEAIAAGAVVTLCGTCCRTRGITGEDVVSGARLGTIHDLAELIVGASKVVSF